MTGDPVDRATDHRQTGEPPPRLAVVVMAKAPIPGEAKTRLGRDIGHDLAATLYQAFLLDTVDLLEQAIARLAIVPNEPVRLLMCPDDRHATLLARIVDPSWSASAQRRPGLLGGLADAFDAGFAAGADVVVATAADSPALPPDHVVAGVRLATTHDVALGPTRDGGYYLIAARRAAASKLPALLLGTSYQSATICAATRDQAERIGLTAAIGPIGFDVDTLDELANLARQLVEEPANNLRHTRAALASLPQLQRR